MTALQKKEKADETKKNANTQKINATTIDKMKSMNEASTQQTFISKILPSPPEEYSSLEVDACGGKKH